MNILPSIFIIFIRKLEIPFKSRPSSSLDLGKYTLNILIIPTIIYIVIYYYLYNLDIAEIN